MVISILYLEIKNAGILPVLLLPVSPLRCKVVMLDFRSGMDPIIYPEFTDHAVISSCPGMDRTDT
jgi:hypothetical protein